MTEPISRTELYARVDAEYRQRHPNAPAVLDDHAPDQAHWRAEWIQVRDHMLNEEVDRVYWDRYPDAPLKLDDHDPAHAKYRRAWLEARDEVMLNAPDPADVVATPSSDAFEEPDLSYVRAGVNQTLVEEFPHIDPDIHDDVRDSVEKAMGEVERAATIGALPSSGFETDTYSVHDMNGHGARFSIHVWHDGGKLLGALSITIDNPLP